MKTLGFKTSLLLIISLILISALLITSIFSYSLLKENAEDNIISRAKSAIKAESNVISSYIEKNSEPAKALASLYKQYDYQTGHEKLAEIAAKTSGVTKITIGFDDGSSFVSKPSAATFPEGIGIKEKYDPRTRSWYKKAKAHSGLILSDIFFTKENVPMFGATHNIDGGVILADIRLGQLQKVLEGVDIMEGAVGIIADNKGMVLASTAKYIKVKENLSKSASFSQYANSILNQQNTMIETDINNQDVLVFSNRILLIGDTHMNLIIILDSDTAFAAMNKLTSTLITTSLLILILASVILVMFLNYLYKPVIDLRDLVTNLASGKRDLTQRLAVKTKDDLGKIAQGVNQFIETLQQNMLSIEQLSNGISSGVSELKQQTLRSENILSDHTLQTNSVAVAMQELDSSAEQVAGSSIEAAELVNSANQHGESSRETINDAQQSIGALLTEVENAAKSVEVMSQETKDINSVLDVIGSIAEQTNLLALNAAIEAARAGEQGRGFAVVADEVRALAARTQESTGEIEHSLKRLRTGSESLVSGIEKTKSTSQNAAKDVHEISDGTDELINQVNQVDKISSVISQSANEQNRVIHEITESVNHINTMVEELSVSGKDIANETNTISSVNDQLSEIIGKFKLK